MNRVLHSQIRRLRIIALPHFFGDRLRQPNNNNIIYYYDIFIFVIHGVWKRGSTPIVYCLFVILFVRSSENWKHKTVTKGGNKYPKKYSTIVSQTQGEKSFAYRFDVYLHRLSKLNLRCCSGICSCPKTPSCFSVAVRLIYSFFFSSLS